MATFVYTAKKKTSETVTGQITAHTHEEAIDLINQLGLLPVSVEAPSTEVLSIQQSGSKKIKTKELYVFSRQLANLLKSGEVLLRALVIIGEQTNNRYFQSVISRIALDVKNGNSFSTSLAVFPHIFSSLYITMVHAGEESGHLETMLLNVSLYQRKQEQITSKVKTAMAYPLFMAGAGVATVYFIMTFILPKMAGLFGQMGSALPKPTVILLAISHGLNVTGLWGLGAILACCIFIYQWGRSAHGQSFLSPLLLHIPLFGEVLLKTDLARFCQTIVLLHRGGVSTIQALQIAIPILKNTLIQEHLTKCKEALTAGGSFGENLKKYKEIPPLMGHLVSVGEESGNLNEVLAEIAMTYEEENDEKIKIMTTLLEPVMILGIGLIIGFIIFAMLLPIFQMDVLV